jgi:predicted acetyltransferase
MEHPLLFLLAEPSRLRARAMQGLWVRLVDVAAALRVRSYAHDGAVVLEVADSFCPWNEGRYRLEARRGEVQVAVTDAAPDLRLPADALGSAYMGGFSIDHLAQAGRIEELRPGAIAEATAMFRSARAPWCPEVF